MPSEATRDWLLVDGSSLIFRAFFGVPASVRAPDGHQVNAVRGFLETLARMLSERAPQRIAVADDADWRPAWRVELLPTYKAHRYTSRHARVLSVAQTSDYVALEAKSDITVFPSVKSAGKRVWPGSSWARAGMGASNFVFSPLAEKTRRLAAQF